MFAIVDIETTGGHADKNGITEIAIFTHDGIRVIDSYTTLINPGIPIPAFLESYTGITNQMVATAPKFHEVANTILKLTQNRTFVAHNVSFDYNFIKGEFAALGYEYEREKLCTVRLSRKLIPGKKTYSLGPLCQSLGISNDARHRAEGDAVATAKLFDILLQIKSNSK
jgi:DNA polymerase-3 subunit epsilon